MKSGELAKLAQVTPRTLRHYRAIGLLPEPPRAENGYCEYQIDDLLKVLRIKNLASLGFSLEKIASMLDEESPEEPTEHLDRLDLELQAQIKHLEEQRRVIALLKREQISVDSPAQYIEFIADLKGRGYPAELLEQTNDVFLLADNLYAQEETEELITFFQRMTDQGLVDQFHAIDKAILELKEDAPEEERARIAKELAEFIIPLVEGFDTSEDAVSDGVNTLWQHIQNDTMTNTAQNDVTNRAITLLREHFL